MLSTKWVKQVTTSHTENGAHINTTYAPASSLLEGKWNNSKCLRIKQCKQNLNYSLPLRPLDYINVDYKTDPLQEVQKKNADQAVVQSAVLETIHILYPEQYWLHIYTDGTLTENNGKAGAGAGIHCKLFSFYLTLGHYATQFDGQLEAMNTALRQLVSRIRYFKKAVIFSDPAAAIHSLTKVNELPSQIPACKLSFHSAKLIIKRNIKTHLSRHMPLKTNTNPRTK